MATAGRTPVERLAEACGIEAAWRDNWLGEHPTRPETAAGLLAAMGVAAGSAAEAERSLEAREEAAWSELVPPVLVLRASAPPQPLTLHLPRPHRRGDGGPSSLRVALELTEESGALRHCSHEGGAVRLEGERAFDGRVFERFTVPLPGPLPLGYHRLRVRVRRGTGEHAREIPLIACPERAYLPPEIEEGGRAAGLAVPLYGLRSERNEGIGDLGDLRRLTAWAVDALGVSFIGLSPLHAVRNRFPHGHSPYLPVSSLFHNPLYLETAAIPEFPACAEARSIAAGAEEFVRALRAAERVNYDEAARHKMRLLRALFAGFLRPRGRRRGGDARRARFEEYLAREGAPLERFALFCAIEERMHASGGTAWSWRQWPEELRSPETPAARELLERLREEVLFHQYLQWQLDEQLAELGEASRRAGLTLGHYHDLAMAVDENGADYWAAQGLYATGARVGAPPDDFNREGQDWGFPPPHPERDRAGGYRAFAEQLRRACRHAGMLRIDHVMRLARLYWIPDGMTAAAGAYVRYPREDLFGIVALESVRNRTVIVGEDLGIVPEGFRERMARERFCSCRLLWFERGEGGRYNPPAAYPADAVVSISTHDLPTFAGFWAGTDIEERLRIGLLAPGELERALEARRRERRLLVELLVGEGLLPPGRLDDPGDPREPDGDLHAAVIGVLARTPSRFFLLSQEDLFKMTAQQNVPGTVTERPNWVHRMPFTIEDLLTEPKVRDYAAMFRGWVERSGRLPRPAR